MPDGPALPGDSAAERHRLPRRAIPFWRVQGLLATVVITGVAAAAAALLPWFTPTVRWWFVAILGVYLLVVRVGIAPWVRWRLCWYAISEDEIDLQHGFLVRTRTVVPMSRVQHLKVEQGPIADRFRVASLHIHTAGGTVPLHALDADQADDIRRRISRLAGLADDV